ncbi:hypothetical protein NX059_002832 [Plenodomus lindquistii]|nr:hypothetical protein NX059_002832 [Plenodomus lindquistii]
MVVDLSHHINAKSRARHPSPLKDIIKYMGYDNMISMAGGLPHPSLFPLQRATFECLPSSATLASGDSTTAQSPDEVDIVLGRENASEDLDLTKFLQYGSGHGNKRLIELCKELTARVHAPPYSYDCILHPGNTNAWAKVVGLLCEDDDRVIVEEFTYPSAQALWSPLGIEAVPVTADAEGIQSVALRSLLRDWDASQRNARRPRVLYLVSVGSNPTGITISAQRRKEIYDICVEFDIIIVEDDPYYFLQYPQYQQHTSAAKELLKPDEFVRSLIPSFISMDHEGRVIRLESFSKTIFPGLRLGYFIANPVFIERLLRATEVETQDPSGLSQAFVLGLLTRWGIDGYLDWLQRLQAQYETRRNWLLEAFYAHFVVLPAAESPVPTAKGLMACVRTEGSAELRPVFSFIDPSAGMFVWSKFYFEGVGRFEELVRQNVEDPEQTFGHELWEQWVTELVLLTPGSYYHPWQGPAKVTTKARAGEARTAHFRFSFATPTSHDNY